MQHIEVIKQDNGKQRGRSSHTQLETRTEPTSVPRCTQTKTPTLNWSNFKPEFSGMPEEDAEAHLLCSNDWMNAHCYVWLCCMYMDLKGCLGVGCHICRCVGAP